MGKSSPARFQIILAQTPQRSFQGAAACTHATPSPNRAHSGLHGETRGVLDGGGITTLGAFCAVRKPCVAGCQNGKLCRFWALVGGALEEHRKPSEQRCAYACRCPEGVAAPLGCATLLVYRGIYICERILQGAANIPVQLPKVPLILTSGLEPYQDMIRIPLTAQRSKSSMLLPHELTDTLRPQELISGFQKNHLSFKK